MLNSAMYLNTLCRFCWSGRTTITNLRRYSSFPRPSTAKKLSIPNATRRLSQIPYFNLRCFTVGTVKAKSLHKDVTASIETQHSDEIRLPHNIYDVVIVGGGIAGCTLACALASTPETSLLRVALIEVSDLTKIKGWYPSEEEFSNRVSSLTPRSVGFLKDIGAWQHVDNSRTRPYEYMQVWDGISDSRLSFDLDNIKSDAIAWIVENNHIQRAILARLEECYNGNVDVFDGTKVEKIFYESESGNEFDLSDWPTVLLSSGKTLKARLLVGADGINSSVRSFAGIDMLGWDYDANAVVATLHVDPLVENRTAWQRFLPTGPIAMLPAMWSTIPALASKLRLLPESDFVHLVNAAFRLRLADLQYFQSQLLEGGDINLQDEITWREQVETKNIADENMEKDRILPPKVFGVQEKSRASFPLKMRNAERYVKERITLVGDAAHTIHPLAGQGLNQGIADVQCLTQTIQAGVNTGQNIGDLELLGEYSSARYLPNLAMIGAVDKLHKLYATEFGPIVWSRSIGLNAINRMSPLKAEIMKFAMGIGTDAHG